MLISQTINMYTRMSNDLLSLSHKNVSINEDRGSLLKRVSYVCVNQHVWNQYSWVWSYNRLHPALTTYGRRVFLEKQRSLTLQVQPVLTDSFIRNMGFTFTFLLFWVLFELICVIFVVLCLFNCSSVCSRTMKHYLIPWYNHGTLDFTYTRLNWTHTLYYLPFRLSTTLTQLDI